jgi:sigma-B regulation protein RsbU (phosphoserine phosphatase)
MRFHPSRRLLAAGASVFAVSLLLYSVAWTYSFWPRPAPGVELGFDADYESGRHDQLVTRVTPGSPAERAGLLRGDRIVAIDGRAYTDAGFQDRMWMLHKPGDGVDLTIERPGESNPLHLAGVFRRLQGQGNTVFTQLSILFPWPFVAVGLAVLFLRLEDPNAWLLALLFGGVAVSRGMPYPGPTPPVWLPVARAFQGALLGMVGPLFYYFYARFPKPSPLDRRWPRLKWMCLGIGLFLSAGGLRTGSLNFPEPFRHWIGDIVADRIGLLFLVGCMVLGLVSFAANFFGTRDPESRRRMRVMFWGTMLSLVPNLGEVLVQSFTRIRLPDWVVTTFLGLLLLTPVFLAYAVVVHRVLEFPVLLRRSAHYLLVQRGFTILLSLGSIGLTLLFAVTLSQYLQPDAPINQPSGIALAAVFGTGLLWSGTQVHKRVSGRIDRAFFRSAYDARVILEELAEKTRTTRDRTELARLLELHLAEALKPRYVRVHLEPDAARPEQPLECAVPIVGREGRQFGALLLGPRLSEEPYSTEDQRLLATVASQAATALENMQMAEEIAARIESERRAAREMEIAREVQTRLLPQAAPRLQTLDCAARCVQARAVGGDYYDFLDLGPGCAGLVLADVSGKGVHAALLVAHLEAYLRSQSSKEQFDPVVVLQEVNRMLYLSTAPEHYATVFFGIYSDRVRELLYGNCGHNPPVLLQHDGSVVRLESTATVLGAFGQWQGSACRKRLDPEDVLAIFSDGITEATCGEEEFGEDRLIEELLNRNGEPASAIVSRILKRVQEFSRGGQSDDLTLLVARGI